MKVLFITTQFPYPLDNGGKIGAYNGLSVLSKENKVTVLSFTEEPDVVTEGIEYYKTTLPKVHFEKPILQAVHIRKKPLKLIKAMAQNYIFNQPYVSSKFDNKKMYSLIDQMLCNQKWDIVFIDYLNMASYGEYIRRKYSNNYSVFILKDHNIEYEIVRQEAEKSKGLKKLILEAEWKRTKKYEERQVSNADIVFSVCDENTQVLKTINKHSYSMLPTFEILEIDRKYPSGNKVLYMGNLSWGANLSGLKWFTDNVLPIIKRQVPDVELVVVGSGPTKNIFDEYENVDYRGYVKDITGIYDDIKVFVVPLFEGSGIRIKILEAFNNEVAVVSTTLGCATIGASDGKELLIRDTEEEFAEAVISLLKDQDLNRTLRNNAKSFLNRLFSLDLRCEEINEIINIRLKQGGNNSESI